MWIVISFGAGLFAGFGCCIGLMFLAADNNGVRTNLGNARRAGTSAEGRLRSSDKTQSRHITSELTVEAATSQR
jgi:hypothetical protein